MTIPQIDLSDEVKARLETRAAEGGFPSIEKHAEALLLASAESAAGDEKLEQLLSARAEDNRPGNDFTPAFAAQFRDQVRQRRASRGARP